MLNDVITEKKIIASIVHAHNENDSKGIGLHMIAEVQEDWFTLPEHIEIYRTIKSLIVSNISPTAIHCDSKLSDGAKSHMWSIGSIATSNDITMYIDDLRDVYVSRRLHDVSMIAVQELRECHDARDTLQNIERQMVEAFVAGHKKAKNESHWKDYIPEYLAEKRVQMESRKLIGIPSGVTNLDNIIGGFRAGETVVVAGRTGMGKSSFVSTMIAKQIMAGYKPALFSFEIDRWEAMDKIISILSEFDSEGDTIPFKSIFNPAQNGYHAGLTVSQLERMGDIVQKYISKLTGWVRGTSRTTVENIMATCRKLKSEGQLDIIYIDHIGLLVQDKKNATAELSHITGSLKLFAGEIGVPIVEVVQLNREADTTKEKPKKSHMKGSGSIEEDANMIIMPWRPYAIDNSGSPNDCELILAKSRNSGTGDIPCYFSDVTTSFTAISNKEDNYYTGNNNEEQDLF